MAVTEYFKFIIISNFAGLNQRDDTLEVKVTNKTRQGYNIIVKSKKENASETEYYFQEDVPSDAKETEIKENIIASVQEYLQRNLELPKPPPPDEDQSNY